MPIIGLMEKTENVFGGLPRIAKLRKGAPQEERKRKDGTPYKIVGRDLDHLRVAFEPEYAHLTTTFKELYGDKPKEFAAYLNADTVHEAFDFWNEEWTATTMLRRCDGQSKHVWYNEKTGFYQNAKVLCDASGKGGCGCQCKAVGRLNVILPAFTMATGVLGYFTIETHSEEDIRTLYARITSIWATFSKIRGVPLIFYRVPRKVTAPEIDKDTKARTGKRMSKTMHMLDLRVEPEFTKEFLLPAITQQRSQLPAPPVSTISSAPKVQLLAPLEPRRLDTGLNTNGNGNGNHATESETVIEEPTPVTTPEEPPKPKPPVWWTHANRAKLVQKAKDSGLMKGGLWPQFLELADMTDEDCYQFTTGAALYEAVKQRKAARDEQPPAPSIEDLEPPATISAPPATPKPDAPNWETDRSKLLALAAEACEKGWITSDGETGIGEMEAMLKHQTWADFPTQFQAKQAIRAIYAEQEAQTKLDAHKPGNSFTRGLDNYQAVQEQRAAELTNEEMDAALARAEQLDR